MRVIFVGDLIRELEKYNEHQEVYGAVILKNKTNLYEINVIENEDYVLLSIIKDVD